ncbi:hypothetical protein DVH05_026220 [Phytophthora capsici]|nr:hypothetical protein DVH05_026220 [Phytophthora capsici]|eukprot:jgi/Phyca11/99266/e_gw1.3.893.1
MKQKWYELVGENGNALTSVDYVALPDDAMAVDLRNAVFAKVLRALPTNVIAPDLTVFANRAAFGAKQKLEEDAPIDLFGGSKKEALIVQAPQRIDSQPHYFITREVREQVRKAVFQIVDPDKSNTDIGMGVFFGPTLAVTCDHNLTDEHTMGSFISIRMKEEMESIQVVARNADLDFAILKSSQPKSFIPPWNGSPDDLEARGDLVLASFRLFKNKLGFTKALCICTFKRHLMYSCPTFAGDSGDAVVMKDGFFAGIHLETINALREQIERKKIIKDCLTDVEQSLDNIVSSGLAQGYCALLVNEFIHVVSE